MRLAVSIDQRYLSTPDGAVWTTSLHPHAFFSRYLAVFDTVTVLARCWPVASVPPLARRVDGPRVQVAQMPPYVGPLGLLRRLGELRRSIAAALDQVDCVVVRMPSQLGGQVARTARLRGQVCALEVVGDPWDAYAPGSTRSLLRPLWRWLAYRDQRGHACRADAVAYVTDSALQSRYPASDPARMHTVPTIALTPEAFASGPRHIAATSSWRLITVAMMQQLYKGTDVLLRACARLDGHATPWHLEIIGDGEYRGELEALARTLGIAGRVEFLGALPQGEAIHTRLDAADLFVLPSRQDGLPRACVEAMARGLPCLASRIGGTPELLGDDALVHPGDVDGLSQRLRAVLTDPGWLTAQSARNLTHAANWSEASVLPRRQAFLGSLKAMALERSGPKPA